MNKIARALALSMMMIVTSSCGKKAQDSKADKPDELIHDTVQSDIIEETHKELQAAIEAQDQTKAREILDKKTQIDLNKQLADGETLLTLAAKYNLIETCLALYNNGANINRANARKETPIMVASMLGFELLAKNLHAYGAKLDAKDANGNTALHLAIMGKYDTLALYLAEYADINITNDNNQTPLMLSEIMNLPKVLNYLRGKLLSTVGLPSEADVKQLLMVGDVQTIKNFFNQNENIKTIYANLNYHVIVITNQPHDKALTIMNYLVEKGISLHGPTEAAETPLIASVKRNYLDFADVMLKQEVNPDVIDDTGKTAIIHAIEVNNPRMVKLLLDYNATEKYDFYDKGKKKTMKSCDVVKAVKKKVASSPTGKANNAEIKEILDCGFLGLF